MLGIRSIVIVLLYNLGGASVVLFSASTLDVEAMLLILLLTMRLDKWGLVGISVTQLVSKSNIKLISSPSPSSSSSSSSPSSFISSSPSFVLSVMKFAPDASTLAKLDWFNSITTLWLALMFVSLLVGAADSRCSIVTLDWRSQDNVYVWLERSVRIWVVGAVVVSTLPLESVESSSISWLLFGRLAFAFFFLFFLVPLFSASDSDSMNAPMITSAINR